MTVMYKNQNQTERIFRAYNNRSNKISEASFQKVTRDISSSQKLSARKTRNIIVGTEATQINITTGNSYDSRESIAQRYNEGRTVKSISEEFGISKYMVYKVLHSLSDQIENIKATDSGAEQFFENRKSQNRLYEINWKRNKKQKIVSAERPSVPTQTSIEHSDIQTPSTQEYALQGTYLDIDGKQMDVRPFESLGVVLGSVPIEPKLPDADRIAQTMGLTRKENQAPTNQTITNKPTKKSRWGRATTYLSAGVGAIAIFASGYILGQYRGSSSLDKKLAQETYSAQSTSETTASNSQNTLEARADQDSQIAEAILKIFQYTPDKYTLTGGIKNLAKTNNTPSTFEWATGWFTQAPQASQAPQSAETSQILQVSQALTLDDIITSQQLSQVNTITPEQITDAVYRIGHFVSASIPKVPAGIIVREGVTNGTIDEYPISINDRFIDTIPELEQLAHVALDLNTDYVNQDAFENLTAKLGIDSSVAREIEQVSGEATKWDTLASIAEKFAGSGGSPISVPATIGEEIVYYNLVGDISDITNFDGRIRR